MPLARPARRRHLQLLGDRQPALRDRPFSIPWFGAAALLCVVRGALVGFAIAIWETTLMELVPTERLGRVISLDYFGSFGLMPVGFVIAAAVQPLGRPGC